MKKENQVKPVNPWLRHLHRDRLEHTNFDFVRDDVQLRLEVELSLLAVKLRHLVGCSSEQSTKMAINIFVEQALELQRQHSQESYKFMLAALLQEDPVCIETRSEIIAHVSLRLKKALHRGMALGLGLAIFAGGIAMALSTQTGWSNF